MRRKRIVPDYYYHQSAVIPFRQRGGNTELLLITSRKKKRWVIPKGVKEPELSAAESAAKEAFEEAGVEGEVLEPPVGSYNYEKWGGVCTVQVFVMEVNKIHEQWQEDYRDREWISVGEASKRVDEDRLKELILSVPDFMSAR